MRAAAVPPSRRTLGVWVALVVALATGCGGGGEAPTPAALAPELPLGAPGTPPPEVRESPVPSPSPSPSAGGSPPPAPAVSLWLDGEHVSPVPTFAVRRVDGLRTRQGAFGPAYQVLIAAATADGAWLVDAVVPEALADGSWESSFLDAGGPGRFGWIDLMVRGVPFEPAPEPGESLACPEAAEQAGFEGTLLVAGGRARGEFHVSGYDPRHPGECRPRGGTAVFEGPVEE
jgi:hypothetical protein